MTGRDLKTGDEIQFFAVPFGSYASVLTRYRVERSKNPKADIRLVNVHTGSSTFDSVRAFRGASFEKLN